MTKSSVHVKHFKQKIDLAISLHPTINKLSELAEAIPLSQDYVSRIVNGSRGLSQTNLHEFSSKLNVPYESWMLDLEDFVDKLGGNYSVLSKLEGLQQFGFDFQSRVKEESVISRLHELIGGHWESYYCSVARSDRLVACRDYVYFGSPTDDGLIPCYIRDVMFEYEGHCFPVENHLYLMLEKRRIFNEIIVYMLNRPQTYPPRLEGLILCKSDGDNQFSSIPSAARVSFRFLGSTEDLGEPKHAHGPRRHQLAQTIPAYVWESDLELPEQRDILGRIQNVVDEDELPNALRMVFGS